MIDVKCHILKQFVENTPFVQHLRSCSQCIQYWNKWESISSFKKTPFKVLHIYFAFERLTTSCNSAVKLNASMGCPTFLNLLLDYIRDHTPAKHLGDCNKCRANFFEWHQTSPKVSIRADNKLLEFVISLEFISMEKRMYLQKNMEKLNKLRGNGDCSPVD